MLHFNSNVIKLRAFPPCLLKCLLSLSASRKDSGSCKKAGRTKGAKNDGELAKQLGGLGGQEGWRLGLVRLTAGDLAPAASVVCVVSEARPRRGRVFGMMALAVDGEMRGQRLATEVMARTKAELLLVAGPRFELRAGLASCMKKGGARFYVSQGWTGREGIWSWMSEASEVEGALRLLASREALEQMLQLCEQDMSVYLPVFPPTSLSPKSLV